MNKLSMVMMAAAFTASPALAGEIVAPPQVVTVNISTNGLNLADPRDVSRLQSRVETAVAAACNPRTSLSIYVSPDRACAKMATAQGQQIVARMASDAAKSRMAEF